MKGIVFTEFIDMVEKRFLPAVADRIACGGTHGTRFRLRQVRP